MHNLNGTKNVCIISLLFLNVALVPYVSSGPLSSFFVIAIIALLILSFFFLTRIFGSQKKSTTYISTILLGSLYLCLTAFFSTSGGDLITETSFYHFLANRELPVLAYKIFTPFLLVLLGFDAADRNYVSDNEQRNIPVLFRFLIIIILALAPVLMFLSFGFNVPLTGALATSGLLTAIIGLALQGNLSNIMSGLFLNIERPFKPGDWIMFDDQLGRIKAISWRSTRLTSIENQEIFVPNDKLAQSTVMNFANNDPSFSKGGFVVYDSIYVHPRHDPYYIIELLKDSLAKARPADNRPFFEYTDAWFTGGKENGLEFYVAYDCLDRALLFTQRSSIMLSINHVFTRAGITMTVGNLLQTLKPDASLGVVQDFSQDILNYQKHSNFENNVYLETQNAELWFRRLKLLSSLEDDDFALLAKTTQKYKYKASDVIVKQGDAGDCMFIIVEGVVKVVIENDNGSSTVLGTLTVGEVFGEMSLLTGASRSATVSAIRPVVLYEIGKDSLGQVMKNNPAVLDGLTEILTKRQEELSAALNDMEGQDEAKKNGLTLFASIKNSLMSYFLSSDKEKM